MFVRAGLAGDDMSVVDACFRSPFRAGQGGADEFGLPVGRQTSFKTGAIAMPVNFVAGCLSLPKLGKIT